MMEAQRVGVERVGVEHPMGDGMRRGALCCSSAASASAVSPSNSNRSSRARGAFSLSLLILQLPNIPLTFHSKAKRTRISQSGMFLFASAGTRRYSSRLLRQNTATRIRATTAMHLSPYTSSPTPPDHHAPHAARLTARLTLHSTHHTTHHAPHATLHMARGGLSSLISWMAWRCKSSSSGRHNPNLTALPPHHPTPLVGTSYTSTIGLPPIPLASTHPTSLNLHRWLRVLQVTIFDALKAASRPVESQLIVERRWRFEAHERAERCLPPP